MIVCYQSYALSLGVFVMKRKQQKLKTFKLVELFLVTLLFISVPEPSLAEESENASLSYRPSSAYDTPFFVESNLEFTLLHELSHAVIELNQIPVLGGNERAADQIAIMLMIMTSSGFDEVLFDKMLSISGEWMIEWRDEINHHSLAFWDVHPLAIQRFYDVTCLVYGAAPDKLEKIRKETWLPIERAWECDTEYAKNRQALLWLANNYSYVSFDDEWRLIQKEFPLEPLQQVKVEYVRPTSSEHEAIYQWLKRSERLNYVVKRTNELLKLPNPVTIYYESQCNGPDAWWNPAVNGIIICYALINQFEENSKKLKPLVSQLSEESEHAYLFLLPEKYSGLMAHDKQAVMRSFYQVLDSKIEKQN